MKHKDKFINAMTKYFHRIINWFKRLFGMETLKQKEGELKETATKLIEQLYSWLTIINVDHKGQLSINSSGYRDIKNVDLFHGFISLPANHSPLRLDFNIGENAELFVIAKANPIGESVDFTTYKLIDGLKSVELTDKVPFPILKCSYKEGNKDTFITNYINSITEYFETNPI